MLIHPWDEMTPTEALAFLTGQGFGHLVASGRGREAAVVAPTQYVVSEGSLWLHLARPNPIWAAIEENPTVLLSVAGDWAYIPGAWKATGEEEPSAGIPTTYYAAVQVTGRAQVRDAPEDLAEVLRRQLAVLDPELPDPAAVHRRRLPQIRGLEVALGAPTTLLGKAKYGGNVDAAHRRAVHQRLLARGGPGDAAAAGRVTFSGG